MILLHVDGILATLVTGMFSHLMMKFDDSSATFMTDVYAKMKPGQGEKRVMNRDSSVVGTSLGPCLVMGAISWLALFTLYHCLA